MTRTATAAFNMFDIRTGKALEILLSLKWCDKYAQAIESLHYFPVRDGKCSIAALCNLRFMCNHHNGLTK